MARIRTLPVAFVQHTERQLHRPMSLRGSSHCSVFGHSEILNLSSAGVCFPSVVVLSTNSCRLNCAFWDKLSVKVLWVAAAICLPPTPTPFTWLFCCWCLKRSTAVTGTGSLRSVLGRRFSYFWPELWILTLSEWVKSDVSVSVTKKEVCITQTCNDFNACIKRKRVGCSCKDEIIGLGRKLQFKST